MDRKLLCKPEMNFETVTEMSKTMKKPMHAMQQTARYGGGNSWPADGEKSATSAGPEKSSPSGRSITSVCSNCASSCSTR